MTQEALFGDAVEDPRAPLDEVLDVYWKAWTDRADMMRPTKPLGMPRSRGSRSDKPIRRALKKHSAEDLALVIRWAFWSSDFAAVHLRGEVRGRGAQTVYLGLENLLRLTKIPGRLELAEAWRDQGEPRSAADGYYTGPKTEPDYQALEDW